MCCCRLFSPSAQTCGVSYTSLTKQLSTRLAEQEQAKERSKRGRWVVTGGSLLSHAVLLDSQLLLEQRPLRLVGQVQFSPDVVLKAP